MCSDITLVVIIHHIEIDSTNDVGERASHGGREVHYLVRWWKERKRWTEVRLPLFTSYSTHHLYTRNSLPLRWAAKRMLGTRVELVISGLYAYQARRAAAMRPAL
jgi:hypothetical protein